MFCLTQLPSSRNIVVFNGHEFYAKKVNPGFYTLSIALVLPDSIQALTKTGNALQHS
jgi:hypothetical protein